MAKRNEPQQSEGEIEANLREYFKRFNEQENIAYVIGKLEATCRKVLIGCKTLITMQDPKTGELVDELFPTATIPHITERKMRFPPKWKPHQQQQAIDAKHVLTQINLMLRPAMKAGDMEMATLAALRIGSYAEQLGFRPWLKLAKIQKAIDDKRRQGYAEAFGDPAEKCRIALEEYDRIQQQQPDAKASVWEKAAAARAEVSARQVRNYLKARRES